MTLSVFFHIYYPESVKEIHPVLEEVSKAGAVLYFHVPKMKGNLHTVIASDLTDTFPGCVVLHSSNRGKDIGGKLVMLNYYLQQSEKTDLIAFMHDKRSLTTYSVNDKEVDGAKWKKELYSVLEGEGLRKTLELFQNEKTGIVAAHQHIYNLREHGNYVIYGNNELQIRELTRQLGLGFPSDPDPCSFVGGTMFWVRSSIYEEFFTAHSPLTLRSGLEEGNFTDRFSGTKAHAMERIFSWIVTQNQFVMEGV